MVCTGQIAIVTDISKRLIKRLIRLQSKDMCDTTAGRKEGVVKVAPKRQATYDSAYKIIGVNLKNYIVLISEMTTSTKVTILLILINTNLSIVKWHLNSISEFNIRAEPVGSRIEDIFQLYRKLCKFGAHVQASADRIAFKIIRIVV